MRSAGRRKRPSLPDWKNRTDQIIQIRRASHFCQERRGGALFLCAEADWPLRPDRPIQPDRPLRAAILFQTDRSVQPGCSVPPSRSAQPLSSGQTRFRSTRSAAALGSAVPRQVPVLLYGLPKRHRQGGASFAKISTGFAIPFNIPFP